MEEGLQCGDGRVAAGAGAGGGGGEEAAAEGQEVRDRAGAEARCNFSCKNRTVLSLVSSAIVQVCNFNSFCCNSNRWFLFCASYFCVVLNCHARHLFLLNLSVSI